MITQTKPAAAVAGRWCLALVFVAAVAWAGLAHAEVLQDETTRIEHHVGKFEAVMVSLGFGSLAGFGLPIVLLTGYGCDKVEACKEVAGSLLHATIFQSHAIALVALFALVVSLLAGNEKISQTLKLPVQLVTMPANALFALLLPLAVTYGPTEPLRTAEVTVAVAGVGQVSWALFLGLVAFSAAVLVLTARLMTSLLVWISPFPLVDALFNVAFHIYAGTAVVLMVFFPKVALVFLIAQYIALILLLRTLPRMTNKVFDALKRLWAKYSVVRVAG